MEDQNQLGQMGDMAAAATEHVESGNFIVTAFHEGGPVMYIIAFVALSVLFFGN